MRHVGNCRIHLRLEMAQTHGPFESRHRAYDRRDGEEKLCGYLRLADEERQTGLFSNTSRKDGAADHQGHTIGHGPGQRLSGLLRHG